MSYVDCEALVLTQLQAVTGFTPASSGPSNTSRGDYSILNTGVGSVYGVVIPGTGNIDNGSATVFFNKWESIIQIWQPYIDDGSTLTNLETNVKAVITRFKQYRHLASSVIQDSYPALVDKPVERWTRGGDGPAFLSQDISIKFVEEEAVTYAE